MKDLLEKYTNGSADLKKSILEGCFNSIMVGAGLSFVTAFAVLLGATSIEIGLLSALPAVLASWAQLGSMNLLDFYHSRKKAIIIFVFLEAISWLPIMLIPFLLKTNSVFWLILFYTAALLFGSIGSPLWQSWMKSLTPPKIIGKYFGVRNSLTGSVALVVLLTCGFALNYFQTQSILVFSGIFLASMVGRLLSTYTLTKIRDPGYKPEKVEAAEEKMNFIDFAKNLSKTNFGYFVLFGSLMTFAIAMTGPFLQYYWLSYIGLKNDYFLYTLIVASSAFAALIAMPYWGKLIDRYGKKKVLKATSYMAIMFPLLIICVRDPIAIIFVEFVDGLIFSGFNLVMASFIYDVSSQQKIVRFSSYQAVFFGTATFLGTILSGYIQSFSFSFMLINTSFFLVCVISILLRMFAYSALIDKIKEIHEVEYIRSKKIVFSVMTLAPVREMFINNAIVLFHDEGGRFANIVGGTVKKLEEEGAEEIKKVEEIIEQEGINEIKKLKGLGNKIKFKKKIK